MLDFGVDYGPEHANSTESRQRLAKACEYARSFLASLDNDLPLADVRTAAELRHQLRTPTSVILQEVFRFAAGLCFERRGQRAFVESMYAFDIVQQTRRLPLERNALCQSEAAETRRDAVGRLVTWGSTDVGDSER